MKLFRPSKNEAQKAKFIFSGIVMSFLLMSYQNCGKVSQTAALNGGKSVEQKPAVLSLNEASSLVLLGDYTNSEFGAYMYKVNVETGEVLRTMYEVPANDPSNKPVKLCIEESKRLALEVEYNKSSVCLFKAKADSHTVCTMEYISPYAIIKDDTNNSYKLGENAKACNDYYDLCTDNRDSFVKAAADILEDIDSSLCN